MTIHTRCYVALVLSVGLVAGARAQEQPQFPAGVEALLLSLNGLSGASAERVSLGRPAYRLVMVRGAVTTALLESKGERALDLKGLTDVSLLCDVRADQAVAATDRAFLSAVAGQIQKTATPGKIETLSAAFASLFANYSVEVTSPESGLANDQKAAIMQRCKSDLAKSPQVYFGRAVTPPAATESAAAGQAAFLDFLSPLAALYNAISAIVTPVVLEGAKIAEERRRLGAVREYLKNEKNRTAIKNAARRLAADAGAFADFRRQQVAGKFLDHTAALRVLTIDPSKIDACKDAFKAPLTRADGLPTDKFMQCYRTVWSAAGDTTAAALKVAQEYDDFADASSGREGEAAAKIGEQLEAIASPNVTTATLQDLMKLAVRLVAFGEKLKAAASKENRDKIEKAIDDLVKSL